jgi:VanZ family protein
MLGPAFCRGLQAAFVSLREQLRVMQPPTKAAAHVALDRVALRYKLPTWLIATGLAAYWCLLLVALHYPWSILRRHASTNTDKVVHLAIYGLLAFLFAELIERLAGASRSTSAAWWQSGLAVVFVALQGAADELTQPLTGRTCDLLDWVADVIGAIVAVALYRLIVGRFRTAAYATVAARG